MKDAFYFSHDANARNDPKILAMMTKYQWRGYGLYWAIVEIMREQENYKLKYDKYIWNALAMQLHIEADQVEEFVMDCVDEFKLFKSVKNYIFSESLLRRMGIKDSISKKRKEAAQKRWSKNKNIDANELQKECNKGKEVNKGKEKKEIIYTPEFEKLKTDYLNSSGSKSQTFKNYKSAKKKHEFSDQQIYTACMNSIQKQKDEGQTYFYQLSNLLGKKYSDDLPELLIYQKKAGAQFRPPPRNQEKSFDQIAAEMSGKSYDFELNVEK